MRRHDLVWNLIELVLPISGTVGKLDFRPYGFALSRQVKGKLPSRSRRRLLRLCHFVDGESLCSQGQRERPGGQDLVDLLFQLPRSYLDGIEIDVLRISGTAVEVFLRIKTP